MTDLQTKVPTIIFQGTDSRIVVENDGTTLKTTFEKTDGQDAMGVDRWKEVHESEVKSVFSAFVESNLALFGFDIPAVTTTDTTTTANTTTAQ